MAVKDTQVKSAGIFGQDGVMWAATDDVQPTPAEVRNLLDGIHDNSKFHENGVVVGGARYQFVVPLSGGPAPDLTGVVGRKGATSVEVIVTGKAVVVATTDAPVSQLTGPLFAARELIKMGF